MVTWLQRHDFTTEDLSEDKEKCLVVLEGFNWEDELQKYEQALDEKRDRCPPGMGFVDGDRVLHIMPVRDGKSHVHYTCDHTARLFALFGATRKLQAWEVPNKRLHILVDLHYAGAQDDLIEALEELGA